MPKLRGPLLSLGATGGLTKLFSLARRMGQHIIERKPIPVDAKSPAQLFNRHMFNKCIDLWHLLSEAEKAEWERLATPRHMTGYAWYISQCLRPNPGIYLPLQGGTMTGDIDMAKNRLLKLPLPTHNQEAANKLYADTHGMQAHESTHIKDGSDEIDSALDIAAMAGLANTKVWQGNAAGRPVEVDPPAAGAVLVVAETEVFNGAAPVAWTDLDLSGTIGAQATLVILKVECTTVAAHPAVAFRRNGDTDQLYYAGSKGCSLAEVAQTYTLHVIYLTLSDTSGVIEWICETTETIVIDVIAYIK
jgi:hypothetical protein